jgi:hypothetical protein
MTDFVKKTLETLQVLNEKNKTVKKAKKLQTCLLEWEEQAKCVQFLEQLKSEGYDVLYTATAQSTFTRSWKQKAKNKAVGTKKGLPDLIIVIEKKLVFCELKREKGGVISAEQKEWIVAIKQSGNLAIVCRGFEEFKNFIIRVINTDVHELKCKFYVDNT